MGVFFRKFILYFILLFFALLWLIPFFFLVMGSFKSTSELFQVPFRWLPKHFDFDNYINMFQQIPFLRYLKNTLIIVFFSVVGALISNSLIAYGFSRLRWPGRDKVFMIVLATMILPYQVTMIPLYLMFTKMHWVGTFLPLIVPQFFEIGIITFKKISNSFAPSIREDSVISFCTPHRNCRKRNI